MKSIAKHSMNFLLFSLLAFPVFAAQSSAPQRFEITAKRYTFQPDQITVQVGRPVVLELTSADVTHGLKVKQLGINATIKKGKVTEVEFTPAKVGIFTGKCSHFCGIGHGSMRMTINVVETLPPK